MDLATSEMKYQLAMQMEFLDKFQLYPGLMLQDSMF